MDDLEDLLRARLAPEPVDVPAEVDQAILALARRRLRRRRPWAWPTGLGAAAAAAGLVAWLALATHSAPAPRGGLDVVDAYRLALQLRTGTPAPREHDHNDDGEVDQSDVAALVRAAVRLPREAGA